MKILLAEDDPTIFKGVEIFLKSKNFEVTGFNNGADAFRACQKEMFDLVLSDVKMPHMTGLELLENIHKEGIQVPVMIMTAFASIEDAVKAMKIGAEDYLIKPLNLEELLLKIKKIESAQNLKKQNEELQSQLKQLQFPDFIGNSKAIENVKQQIRNLSAQQNVPVMIYGNSGTGKEVVARSIHQQSSRCKKAFVPLNCAAIPENLIESELFGYRKGAFTGAYYDKPGYFQQAHKGTLFLDEVSEMSPRMQAVLLRTLQEGTIQVLGSSEETGIDVRVIGASNKDLQQMVAAQTFREDLFYRLNVVEMNLPDLAEHREDIPFLLNHFATRYTATITFTADFLDALQQYNWPGNVRELENLLRMLIATKNSGELSVKDLPEKFQPKSNSLNASQTSGKNLKEATRQMVAQFEEKFIRTQLEINEGNISSTANEIGISRAALHQKIKQYKIKL